MSYIEKTLSNDEKIEQIVKLHWFNYVSVFIILFLGLLLFFYSFYLSIPFLILFLYGFWKLHTTEMMITNKRIISKRGIISVKTEELKNSKIESVEIKQTIIGRIFRYGTINFTGTGGAKVSFAKISNPRKIKTALENFIDL